MKPNTIPIRFGTGGDISPFAEEAHRRGERLRSYRTWFNDDGTMCLALIGQYIGMGKFSYLVALEDVRRWLWGMGKRGLADIVSTRIKFVRKSRRASPLPDARVKTNRVVVLEEIAGAAERLLNDPGNAMDRLEELEEKVNELEGGNWL